MKSIHQINWQKQWFLAILVISIIFLVITYFRYELRESVGIERWLVLFDLTAENNIAAWWSGILLLIAGIHGVDGYFLWKGKQPTVAKGWGVLSVVLLILSADEISSMHERVNMFSPFGTWLSLLPFGIILSAMLIYALMSIWKVKENRTKVYLIILGLFCFATVAMQEFLEHTIEWSPQLMPLRGTVEEGTELLGVIILLKTCMMNSKGIFCSKNSVNSPVFEFVCSSRNFLPVAVIFLAPVLALITASLPDQSRGHPADWLAALLFIFAGIAALMRFFKNKIGNGLLDWTLALLCFFASASSVFILPRYDINIFALEANFRMLIFFIISILFIVIWFLNAKHKLGIYIILAMIILSLLALYSTFNDSLFKMYLLPQCFGGLTYYVHSKVYC